LRGQKLLVFVVTAYLIALSINFYIILILLIGLTATKTFSILWSTIPRKGNPKCCSNQLLLPVRSNNK